MILNIRGWRFWCLTDGDLVEGETRLCAPYGSGVASLASLASREDLRWNGRVKWADCAHDLRFQPGCECGIYGSESVVDVLCQGFATRKYHLDQWRRRSWLDVCGRPPVVLLVFGEVLLLDAIRQQDPLDANVMEVRAAGAEIESLYVADRSRVPGWTEPVLAEALTHRYQVPVFEELPRYTMADWQRRSRGARTLGFDFDYAGIRCPGS